MAFLRRVAGSLTLIVIVALALRIAFAWSYQAHLPHRALSVIPFLFESGNIAHSIATGGGFASPFRVNTGPTAWMTPVYPYLLAAAMKLFGPYTFASWVAAVAVNIAFSCLVCIPLYFAARKIGGPGLAAGAAWLWAIFPNAIQMTYESLWDTSVSAFIATTLFWATLRVAQSRTLRACILYGLLWGLALMTNASLLSTLPFLAGWAAWRRRRLQGLMAAVLVAAICCVPWTIRNWEVFHALIPLRSVLGLQLWCGNNPQAKVVWLGDQHPIHDQAERDRYVEMGEIAYMREKERNAIAYMATHPTHEIQLITGRFVSIWTAGTPTPIADFLRTRSAWFRYVLLFNIAVAFGTLAGLVILFVRRSPFAFPAAVYPVVFPWAYYLTLALPRYRHPIEPVLLLLSAIAIQAMFARRGSRVTTIHAAVPASSHRPFIARFSFLLAFTI
jgi:4-amino-4-deoxy-L-arabinose transferase-like glycosyltransferase